MQRKKQENLIDLTCKRMQSNIQKHQPYLVVNQNTPSPDDVAPFPSKKTPTYVRIIGIEISFHPHLPPFLRQNLTRFRFPGNLFFFFFADLTTLPPMSVT